MWVISLEAQLNVRSCLLLSVVTFAVALLLTPNAGAEPDADSDPTVPSPTMTLPAVPSPVTHSTTTPSPAVPGAEAAIARAETLLGTDKFGHYGCEAFVAFAYNVSQAKYGWDGASETMYQTLLKEGQLHTDTNPPRGALVFSRGSDGPHIDISRGDGTYLSGGVQGLSRGYGNGHDIQILPTANVGRSWTYRGWATGFPQ